MSSDGDDVIFQLEGRLIVVKRYSNETDPYFQERASFILTFRNQKHLYERAIKASFYHANKMFHGTVYDKATEEEIYKLRAIHLENRGR